MLAAGLAAQVAILAAMGQPAICPCGWVSLWHGGVSDGQNSQHILDWWTPSHVLHGVIFYAVLHLLAPRLAVGTRLVIALVVEIAWEIVENTPLVIDRYRATEHAQTYGGDSILNSVADSLAMILGFVLARRLPVPVTVALVVVAEVVVALLVRDNLTLNVIQLLAPSETLSRWQAGG